MIETLNVDWHTKYIALLVNVASEAHTEGAQSVLLAHRQGFDTATDLTILLPIIDQRLISARTVELLDYNDIYYSFLIKTDDLIECKLQLIHPATAQHIAKYRKQCRRFVAETPDLYARITMSYIDRQAAHRIRWIDNILSGASEQDRVIIKKEGLDGFVILPDCKWNQKAISSLYLLALINRRDVRSLRDLTSEHLPMLKDLKNTIAEIVPRQYAELEACQLRVYIHYLPTYYYFHVHIVHVDLETPGCHAGTAHLLDDVIDNIENVASDYYQKRTLHYILGVEHELYQLLQRSECHR